MISDGRHHVILTDDLRKLLSHYVEAASADPKKWHDRVMALDDATPLDLARWHGQLLAADWIEQQTGAAPRWHHGEVPACYRATPAGRKLLQR